MYITNDHGQETVENGGRGTFALHCMICYLLHLIQTFSAANVVIEDAHCGERVLTYM